MLCTSVLLSEVKELRQCMLSFDDYVDIFSYQQHNLHCPASVEFWPILVIIVNCTLTIVLIKMIIGWGVGYK